MAIKRRLALKQFKVVHGWVRDISTTGVYFTCQERLAVGDKVEFSLSLPMEETGGAEVSIEAQGRVVRVEMKHQTGHQPVGIAAVIERYETIRTKARDAV